MRPVSTLEVGTSQFQHGYPTRTYTNNEPRDFMLALISPATGVFPCFLKFFGESYLLGVFSCIPRQFRTRLSRIEVLACRDSLVMSSSQQSLECTSSEASKLADILCIKPCVDNHPVISLNIQTLASIVRYPITIEPYV